MAAEQPDAPLFGDDPLHALANSFTDNKETVINWFMLLVFGWAVVLLITGCRDQQRAERVRTVLRKSYTYMLELSGSLTESVRRASISLRLAQGRHRGHRRPSQWCE